MLGLTISNVNDIKSFASARFVTEVKLCTLFVFVSKVLPVIPLVIIVVQHFPPRTGIMTGPQGTVP